MLQVNSQESALKCLFPDCEEVFLSSGREALGPGFARVVRKGFFFRRSDRKRVGRLFCRHCGRGFSQATSDSCYRQKKRHLNEQVYLFLNACVSKRRTARLLGIDRKTVDRKLVFLGVEATKTHQQWLQSIQKSGSRVERFQFDELETFERSKCLPLSVPLVVEEGTRKILGFRVASMPANGPLAEISRKKYGPRKDERAQAVRSLFEEISSVIAPNAHVTSDQNPKYRGWIKRQFPTISHTRVKGRDGCVVGQGELKKVGFDPIFDLNHTCAMLRANINRLVRRTWCTTKRPDRLVAHIALYVDYHNRVLTKPRAA